MIIGAAGSWFLLDIAYYGTTISSPLVLKSLNSHADALTNMVYTLLIFIIAALPGYIVAALTIDRPGRKFIQCFGLRLYIIAATLTYSKYQVIGLFLYSKIYTQEIYGV